MIGIYINLRGSIQITQGNLAKAETCNLFNQATEVTQYVQKSVKLNWRKKARLEEANLYFETGHCFDKNSGDEKNPDDIDLKI